MRACCGVACRLSLLSSVIGLGAMPSLLRSAAWRCRLRRLDAGSRRGVAALSRTFVFVHVVHTDAGPVHVFVYDHRKVVRSALEELLPGARWRPLAGPGGAEVMWDLRGRHSVHGRPPDSGLRVDPAVARRLLDSRLLLAGDSSSLEQLDRGVRIAELWAGRGRVSEAVAELGGVAVRFGFRWGQDFSKAAVRAGIDGLVDRASPGTVLCAPMCGPWSSFSGLNVFLHGPGFANTLRLRRLRQVVILRWMCDLLLRQLLRGGDVVVEQPRSSRMWRVCCLQRLIRRARLHGLDLAFVDLDQCAFGLVDPASRRAFKKATRLLVSSRRFSTLGRKCRCRRPHQHLAGSTRYRGFPRRRTCLAECYPRKLALALAELIR